MVKSVLGKLSVFFVGLLLVASTLVASAPTAHALTRDFDANAVMYGGAADATELKNKYRFNQGSNLQAIYKHFNIDNEAALDGMVMGKVTKSNEVWVGSKKVATSAVTVGRQNMPGSTKIPGIEAYMRSPAVSFRSDSLEALVKMKGDVFQYAVILSCGNPVKANPVPPAKPKPTPPQKPKPQPQPEKPTLNLRKDVRIFNGQQWTDWAAEGIEGKAGNQAEFRITIDNLGGKTDLKNVKLKDDLPSGVSFANTETLRGSADVRDKTIGQLTGEGINLGTIAKGQLKEVVFTVTLGEAAAGACETRRNIARARADEVGEKTNDARVRICKPVTPVVAAAQTPPPAEGGPEELVKAGGAGAALGIFSVTSFLGAALYKLKDFYLAILR